MNYLFNLIPEFKNPPKIVHLPKELNGQQMPMSKRSSMKSQQNVNDEDEREEHPQKKMTYKIRGHMREYHFLKTVKSMEELDKFRFKVSQWISLKFMLDM
jgi:hypothetical protein